MLFGIFRTMVVLQFHFETFEYSKKIIYQETFADFLCKSSKLYIIFIAKTTELK